MPRFVPKDRTVNALLPAGVFESAPHKHGIPIVSSEDDLFTGAAEQNASASVRVSVGGIVALIQGEAIGVAIFSQPPERFYGFPLAASMARSSSTVLR